MACWNADLVLSADPFLPAALGKGQTTSGIKDVLGEGFGFQVFFWKDLIREN